MAKKISRPKQLLLDYQECGSIDEELTLSIATRNIYLMGDIDTKSARRVISTLHLLDRMGKDPIRLYLCSEGGFVSDSKVILDALYSMKNSKVDVIATGYAESCAAELLILSPPQHRWITPTSYLMLHNMYSTWEEPLEMKKKRSRMKWEAGLENRDIKALAKIIDLTEEKLTKKISANEWYIPVDEALKLNMVDGVWQ